jgi:hypothetical protein
VIVISARRGEAPLAFQLLIYPMLDDRTGSTHRLPAYRGAYVWVPESNRFGWTALPGVPAGSRSVPAGAVPARALAKALGTRAAASLGAATPAPLHGS